MKPYSLLLALTLAMGLMLSGCGQAQPEQTEKPERTVIESEEELPSVAFPEEPIEEPESAVIEVGSAIFFGAYPQNTEEPEPIEWIVLDDRGDRVLLLTKDCVETLPWHNAHESITWDACDLRAWLNDDFLRAAFTADEQESILLSDLENGDDLGYGTLVGENTQDNVFLLSGAELERYLSTEESRTVKPTEYVDPNGDIAYLPDQFKVSEKKNEQTVNTGLVVIGPDGSEFVWVPTTVTPLEVREFGSYFSGGSLADYHDETELESYREMLASVEAYGGFYIGRYEASKGADGLPASKRVTEDEPGEIWVRFSPQDTTVACQSLHADNDTVQGFFPWGINWDTTLQWLIDSGCKLPSDVKADSTRWGNYSNDSFSEGARGSYTGAWEEAKANNIYDLAGNNWEWTQERCGSDYVMRGGGYSLMGGACPGNRYPAALRDPLPGNDHHPNVTFRIALYLKGE